MQVSQLTQKPASHYRGSSSSQKLTFREILVLLIKAELMLTIASWVLTVLVVIFTRSDINRLIFYDIYFPVHGAFLFGIFSAQLEDRTLRWMLTPFLLVFGLIGMQIVITFMFPHTNLGLLATILAQIPTLLMLAGTIFVSKRVAYIYTPQQILSFVDYQAVGVGFAYIGLGLFIFGLILK